MLRFLGVDRAVAFTLFYRGWQLFANAAVLVLIARSLSPAEQGFYYLFFSILLSLIHISEPTRPY